MMSSEAANRKIIAEELAKDSPNWKRIEDASRLFGVSTYGPEKGLRITEGLGLVAVT